MFSVILIVIVVVLILVAIIVLVVQEYMIEVRPNVAYVYNNMWTGETKCLLAGTGIIIPGVHKELEKEVSLKNEAENPSNIMLITGDGIELEIDYLIRRLQVGYPLCDREAVDPDELKKAAIKAATAIDYEKRRDKILTRVVAKYQAELEKRSVNALFPDYDPKKDPGEDEGAGNVNHEEMTKIEDEVNKALKIDLVTTEWGFWVETDFEDCNLPAVVRKAREDASSAKIAGKAIKDKADESGVSGTVLVIADAIASFLKK